MVAIRLPGAARLGAALAAVAAVLVLVLAVPVVLPALSGDPDADLRVNLSGRQRMLTERVAVEHLLAVTTTGSDHATHLDRLDVAADVLLRSEQVLLDGGEVLDLDGVPAGTTLPPADDDVRAARAGLVEQVSTYVTETERATADPSAAGPPVPDAVAQLRWDLVTAEDAATTAEQDVATATRAHAHQVALAALLSALLLAACVLVWAVRVARSRARRGEADRADATFRALLTGAREGLLLLGPDGVVRYASPAAATLGLDPEGSSGTCWTPGWSRRTTTACGGRWAWSTGGWRSRSWTCGCPTGASCRPASRTSGPTRPSAASPCTCAR